MPQKGDDLAINGYARTIPAHFEGLLRCQNMDKRIPTTRGIWPLLVVFGSAATIGVCGTLGCGGAAQSDAKDPSTAPIATYTSEGFGQAEASDDSSYLEILSDPPVDVLVDGKSEGKTPIKKLKVTPGSHDVTFDDEVGGPRTMSVVVQPGDYQTIKSDRPISLKK